VMDAKEICVAKLVHTAVLVIVGVNPL
jgi:hypothetical protein